MLIKTLGKTYVKEILTLLNKHGELHFSKINKNIPTHKSSLNRTLSFLINEGLIKKRQEHLKTPLPKSYYSLTTKGKKASETGEKGRKSSRSKKRGVSREKET